MVVRSGFGFNHLPIGNPLAPFTYVLTIILMGLCVIGPSKILNLKIKLIHPNISLVEVGLNFQNFGVKKFKKTSKNLEFFWALLNCYALLPNDEWLKKKWKLSSILNEYIEWMTIAFKLNIIMYICNEFKSHWNWVQI